MRVIKKLFSRLFGRAEPTAVESQSEERLRWVAVDTADDTGNQQASTEVPSVGSESQEEQLLAMGNGALDEKEKLQGILGDLDAHFPRRVEMLVRGLENAGLALHEEVKAVRELPPTKTGNKPPDWVRLVNHLRVIAKSLDEKDYAAAIEEAKQMVLPVLELMIQNNPFPLGEHVVRDDWDHLAFRADRALSMIVDVGLDWRVARACANHTRLVLTEDDSLGELIQLVAWGAKGNLSEEKTNALVLHVVAAMIKTVIQQVINPTSSMPSTARPPEGGKEIASNSKQPELGATPKSYTVGDFVSYVSGILGEMRHIGEDLYPLIVAAGKVPPPSGGDRDKECKFERLQNLASLLDKNKMRESHQVADAELGDFLTGHVMLLLTLGLSDSPAETAPTVTNSSTSCATGEDVLLGVACVLARIVDAAPQLRDAVRMAKGIPGASSFPAAQVFWEAARGGNLLGAQNVLINSVIRGVFESI